MNPAADAARHRGRAGEGQDGAGDEADREPRGAVVLDRLRERALSTARDGLMLSSVLTGALSGIQGARLARQATDGAVPVETGTKPALDTPPQAAKIQRSLGLLGNLNIASGIALVAVNAILAQTNHSRPSTSRALRRSSSPDTSLSPLWIGSGVATVAALGDQLRRRLT